MFAKKACIVLVSLIILSSPAFAAKIGGLDFPDKVNVGGQELILNGGGERSDYGIGIYQAALYLKQKSDAASSIVGADQPIDVKLQITSVLVTADNIKGGFKDAFKSSATSDITPLQSKIEAFGDAFKGLKKLDIFDFAYTPGKGVEISRNGKAVTTIQGMDFKKALYGIWLGEKPVQSNLKEKMLGK